MTISREFEVTLSVRWLNGGVDGVRGSAQWRTYEADGGEEFYELVVIVLETHGEAVGLIRAGRLTFMPTFHAANGIQYRLDQKSVERALVEMDLFLEHG